MILGYSTGGSVDFTETVLEHGEIHHGFNRGRAVFVFDMDGTMLDADAGITVFMEKLADPTFWTYSGQQFSKLLLPPEYHRIILLAAGNHINGISPELATFILSLHHDITELYNLKRGFLRKRGNGLTIDDPLVNEFARKMYEFDSVLMGADTVLSQIFDGKLLMRLRFFAGKNIAAIQGLTRKALSRATHEIFHLSVHENSLNYDRQVTGDQLGPIDYKMHIPVIQPTLEMAKALNELGVPGLVVTTNLLVIARTCVAESDYGKYFHPKDVVGTRLQRGRNNPNNFTPDFDDGSPVFAEKKVDMIDRSTGYRTAAKALRGETLTEKEILKFQTHGLQSLFLAAGDSPSNDGPMLHAALRDGGIAVLVGPNFESVRRRFDGWFRKVQADPKMARFPEQRTLVIETAA